MVLGHIDTTKAKRKATS